MKDTLTKDQIARAAVTGVLPNDSQQQSIAPLIQETERVIREAKAHFGLAVNTDNIVVTIQTAGRRNALGWYWNSSWQNGKKERIHEINLSAEHLKTCDVGELILHELAHAENAHLKIMDCTASQVHNKKFKAMAERLGLIVKPRDKRVGYGFTELGDGGKAFLAQVEFKRQLFSVARLKAGKKGKVGSRLIKAECPECGYVIRTTHKWIEKAGLPTCPCGTDFEEAGE